MKLKSLLHALGWKFSKPEPVKPYNRPPLEAGKQKAILLDALVRGRIVGHREACELLGTHNAPRRLNQLKQVMRTFGVRYTQPKGRSASGKEIVLTFLPADQREKARGLLGTKN